MYTDYTTFVLVQKEKSPPKAAAAAPPAAAPAAPAAAGKAGEFEEKILAQVGNPSSSYFTGNYDIYKRAFSPVCTYRTIFAFHHHLSTISDSYCSCGGDGSEIIITC